MLISTDIYLLSVPQRVPSFFNFSISECAGRFALSALRGARNSFCRRFRVSLPNHFQCICPFLRQKLLFSSSAKHCSSQYVQSMLKTGSVPALDFRNALPSHPTTAYSTGGNRGARSSSAQPHSPAISHASIVHEPTAEVAFISSLKQWNEIDASDYEGKWFQAFVVWRNEHHIRVHFVGWQKQWCENISIIESYARLRPRNADTKIGPGGPQTVKDIMSLYRCVRCLQRFRLCHSLISNLEETRRT
jgi:hypothetical protein